MISNITRPPMGFSSWDCYGNSVNEAQILKNAEYLKEHLAAYCYDYVVVNIQWYESQAKGYGFNHFYPLCMDAYSRLIPSPERFPSSKDNKGFLPLAQKLHSMGLKFGLHIMRGITRQAVHGNTPLLNTSARARDIAKPFSVCPFNNDMYGVEPKRIGAFEYYKSLIDLYESWEVDFLQIDDICRTEQDFDELTLYHDCLEQSSRDMVLSLSPGPFPLSKAQEISENTNLFSLTTPVLDSWADIVRVMDSAVDWGAFKYGSVFPDCGSLPIGSLLNRHSLLTEDELWTMMRFWCLLGSSLFIGGRLEDLSPLEFGILTDQRLLKLQRQGTDPRLTYDKNGLRIWQASLDGKLVTALFNLSDKPISLSYQGQALNWQTGEIQQDNAVSLKPHASALFQTL